MKVKGIVLYRRNLIKQKPVCINTEVSDQYKLGQICKEKDNLQCTFRIYNQTITIAVVLSSIAVLAIIYFNLAGGGNGKKKLCVLNFRLLSIILFL